LRDDPRGRVRDADVENLSGADDVVERSDDVLDRGEDVPDVHPVEIDGLGAQPPQARLQGLHETLAMGAAAVGIAGAHVQRVVRREHPPLALGRDQSSDDALAGAPAPVIAERHRAEAEL
jgi:hypothetical protein